MTLEIRVNEVNSMANNQKTIYYFSHWSLKHDPQTHASLTPVLIVIKVSSPGNS